MSCNRYIYARNAFVKGFKLRVLAKSGIILVI